MVDQRDDRIESHLLAQRRKGGLASLAGPREIRADGVVLLLLDVTRAEIHAFLKARSISFRRDASNGDLRLDRNRLPPGNRPARSQRDRGDTSPRGTPGAAPRPGGRGVRRNHPPGDSRRQERRGHQRGSPPALPGRGSPARGAGVRRSLLLPGKTAPDRPGTRNESSAFSRRASTSDSRPAGSSVSGVAASDWRFGRAPLRRGAKRAIIAETRPLFWRIEGSHSFERHHQEPAPVDGHPGTDHPGLERFQDRCDRRRGNHVLPVPRPGRPGSRPEGHGPRRRNPGNLRAVGRQRESALFKTYAADYPDLVKDLRAQGRRDRDHADKDSSLRLRARHVRAADPAGRDLVRDHAADAGGREQGALLREVAAPSS